MAMTITIVIDVANVTPTITSAQVRATADGVARAMNRLAMLPQNELRPDMFTVTTATAA